MRDGKKPRGMKHKIREERKREERIALAVTVAILIVVILVSGFFTHSMISSSPQNPETVNSTSERKAAKVDHLSLTHPNQTFIQTATNTLKQAGYSVDYTPGERVTVEFYRNLPAREYDSIGIHNDDHDVSVFGNRGNGE